MRYFLRYLWEWLKYTPFFFCHAPVKKWWKYFGSAHRMARGMIAAKTYVAAGDDMWDRTARRIEMLKLAEGGQGGTLRR